MLKSCLCERKLFLVLLSCLITFFGFGQTSPAIDYNTIRQRFEEQQRINQTIYKEKQKADSLMVANLLKQKQDSLMMSAPKHDMNKSARTVQPESFTTQTLNASSVTSANLGFENGFQDWIGSLSYYPAKCGGTSSKVTQVGVMDLTGDVSYSSNIRSYWDKDIFQTGPALVNQPARHTILTDKNYIDPFGNFKVLDSSIPELGNTVVRLGNHTVGACRDGNATSNSFLAEQESLSYTFFVGPNDKYLYINYAVVLNEPTDANHKIIDKDMTFFSMSLIDNSNGQVFDCSNVDVYATSLKSNIPNFVRSNVEPWNVKNDAVERLTVVYKPWSLALVDLTSFEGKTVTLRFETGDCKSGGHWAYAYVNAYISSNGIKAVSLSNNNADEFSTCQPVNFSSAYTGRYDDETYFWDFGDGTAGATQSPSHVYSSSGEYTVTLKVTSSKVNSNCSISKKITITSAVSVDAVFTTQPYLCATRFLSDVSQATLACNSISYFWTFGDGTTSEEKNPIHSYSALGSYNASLKLTYNCEGCQGEVSANKTISFSPTTATLENELIEAETDTKNQILSVSAVTFSDTWPLPHDNAALSNKGSYLNGSQGIWRNNASYVYNVPRQLSPVTNVAKDGTFTLNQFDWDTAPLNIVPNWIEANSMTKYSPYSYELENQDVLGVYSAALYDYGGHLPSANGVNMRHAEMGFTSFEYKEGLEPIDQKGKPSGNWMLSNSEQSATLVYKVPIATAYMAVANASLDELEAVQKVDVAANTIYGGLSFMIRRRPFNFLQDVPVLCKQAHPTDPSKSIIVLARAPFEGLWTGSITVKRTALPSVDGVFDGQIAHSGKKSLKITSPQTFRQEMFELEADKSYWINAWVSIAQPNLPTPLLANGIGIEIALKNKQGQEVGKFVFEPVGTIIEGWQQIKGTFISPIKNPLLEITFKPGNGGITAWYDDLRLQPEEGNMKAYVYDLNDYRLHAILDEENYGSFFYYDAEGNLYLTKKETEKGIKTISENISYQIEKH